MAEKTLATKTWAQSGQRQREKSWSADLEIFNFSDYEDRYVRVRLVTAPLAEKLHWVFLDVKNARRKR
jgi:hypothetical protein